MYLKHLISSNKFKNMKKIIQTKAEKNTFLILNITLKINNKYILILINELEY